MKPGEFKTILDHVATLTRKQRVTLLLAIDGMVPEEPKTIHEIEERVEGDLHCPDCQSHNIGKWGKAHGLKRFRCRDCKRTFNALTGTPLAHLRKKEKWDDFAGTLQASATVRGSAEVCGVHRNTTFRWRHRFLAWINENKPPSLHGVVEADETFFLESQKGSRHLGRKPRKRGGKASKRGRSSEQVCVLVARDRSGLTTDHVLPAFNAEELDGLLGPAIDPDAMLCTDGAGVYAAFAEGRGLLHEAVNLSAGERVRAKTIHIQNVNAYHSRLKGWLAPFHGVSTHWLPNYLGWRRMLDGHEKFLSPTLVLRSAIGTTDFNTLR